MKLFLAAVLFASLLFSQTFLGSLRGRVVDPAGAVTPGVQITLTDEATALARTTVSNDQGEYVFESVNPATYTLAAESTGFKHLDRKGILVATRAAVTVDLELQLGQVSEQVTVTSDAPILQTADASIGQVIDAQKCTAFANFGDGLSGGVGFGWGPAAGGARTGQTRLRIRRCPWRKRRLGSHGTVSGGPWLAQAHVAIAGS